MGKSKDATRKEERSLFDQTKDIVIVGQRLSGEPEIVHEIEDHMRATTTVPIVRTQIRKILELVPSVFPEDWKSPDRHSKLNPEQREAYFDILRAGISTVSIPGPIIQKVIAYAVRLRDSKDQSKESAPDNKAALRNGK